MTTEEKHDFSRLIKHFGAEKGLEMYNEFREKYKDDEIMYWMNDKGEYYINEIEPKRFKEFVNNLI